MPHAATSAARTPLQSPIEWWLARTSYAFFWLVLLTALYLGLTMPDELSVIVGVKGAITVGLLILLEYRFPVRSEWGMNRRVFLRRDLVLLAVNGAVAGALNYGLVLLALDRAQVWNGPMTGQPLWLQVLVGLVAFETLQYGVHRLMHQDAGSVSRFLWRVHAIHHVPHQLYVVMHAVFHPVNLVVVRLGVQLLPLWLLGFDPEAVFVYGSVIGLHATISHLNFDMRLGWFNYVFVGPELHRYHHSAKSHEAVNYGSALVFLDLIFDTFKYTPGRFPDALGLRERDGYPGQAAPFAALLFPFRSPPSVTEELRPAGIPD